MRCEQLELGGVGIWGSSICHQLFPFAMLPLLQSFPTVQTITSLLQISSQERTERSRDVRRDKGLTVDRIVKNNQRLNHLSTPRIPLISQ